MSSWKEKGIGCAVRGPEHARGMPGAHAQLIFFAISEALRAVEAGALLKVTTAETNHQHKHQLLLCPKIHPHLEGTH